MRLSERDVAQCESTAQCPFMQSSSLRFPCEHVKLLASDAASKTLVYAQSSLSIRCTVFWISFVSLMCMVIWCNPRMPQQFQIGKWHCGMSGIDRLPVHRGFSSSFGYVSEGLCWKVTTHMENHLTKNTLNKVPQPWFSIYAMRVDVVLCSKGHCSIVLWCPTSLLASPVTRVTLLRRASCLRFLNWDSESQCCMSSVALSVVVLCVRTRWRNKSDTLLNRAVWCSIPSNVVIFPECLQQVSLGCRGSLHADARWVRGLLAIHRCVWWSVHDYTTRNLSRPQSWVQRCPAVYRLSVAHASWKRSCSRIQWNIVFYVYVYEWAAQDHRKPRYSNVLPIWYASQTQYFSFVQQSLASVQKYVCGEFIAFLHIYSFVFLDWFSMRSSLQISVLVRSGSA